MRDGPIDVVAGAVERAPNAVAEVVADLAETAGNGLGDGLTWLGTHGLGRMPSVGKALSAASHWLGGVVASALDLLGALVKGAVNLLAGLVAGVVRLLGGAITGDKALIAAGGRDLLGALGGPVLVIGGKALALVQSLLAVTPRRLNAVEQRTLSAVYRDSIAFYNVRIVEGWCGVFGFNRRPFTLGNTIYMKARTDLGTLVHECGHVWQNQHIGSRYTMDAVFAQWTIKPSPNAAYKWEEEAARGRTRWIDFNKESQAELLSDVYKLSASGAFYVDDPVGDDVTFVFEGTDRTDFAKETVAYVRGSKPARLSRGLNRSVLPPAPRS